MLKAVLGRTAYQGCSQRHRLKVRRVTQRAGREFAYELNRMLEEIAVIYPTQRWQESRRGALSATVAREFPSIFVTFAADDGSPLHVSASQWSSEEFDSRSFDTAVDQLADEPFTLRVADDRGERPEFPLEVLNRCQRLIGRRNVHSQGRLFDRILERHRALHDPGKPLARADYNHALDVWQWVLRLNGSASLAVQVAALFHDVERFMTDCVARLEPGVPAAWLERVAELISHHERPANDPEVVLLNDADALSFFSLDSSRYADDLGEEQTRKKIACTWNRMSSAARAKLARVCLRGDVRRWLDELR